VRAGQVFGLSADPPASGGVTFESSGHARRRRRRSMDGSRTANMDPRRELDAPAPNKPAIHGTPTDKQTSPADAGGGSACASTTAFSPCSER
jgi:hypothetical protein